MPRPEVKTITFSIDGREVQATEGTMLVDAAKNGDVEIPVFCYEPKLGQPVGACRMCLVEIEGIPKLQTGCSTPVKDGMVVHTQTERVKGAQEAVVEFLLINHPLDCPVCDKGGECPLQDISYGWGGGRSRFVEPKRHFKKPLELSPLIAIDRERCILCYRCVRFSQEVAEDYQLVLMDRGAHSYVGTFDDHPYVAPFSGNILELCPVGALTSQPYRFRARPWDIEQSGSVCTLCPSQCNVSFTVRDDRVLRVLARDNAGVDDGWLCDKGRFAYQHVHADERITQPMVREGDALRPVKWERALEAAAALGKHKGKTGAIVGGQATNEEGFLLARLMREGLGSPHIDARVGGSVPVSLARALAAPALQASVADLEFAHTVLVLDCEPVDDAPILDLRIRKGVRRRGVKLAVASSRPSSLDPNAQTVARYAPGRGGTFVRALAAAMAGEDLTELALAAGAFEDDIRATADLLTRIGEDVVVVYGERLAAEKDALKALLNLAHELELGGVDGAGLLELPAGTNGRGLREVGCLPDALPGYAASSRPGVDAAGIARLTAHGDLTALYLLHADPLRTHPDAETWRAALGKASLVVAHSSVMTEGIREYADVVFPAEAYAEKEGTVTHPDGRVQRLRPAIGRPREVRAEWQVLADLGDRLGVDLGVLTGSMATHQVFAAVPFYTGLTLDVLAGHGVRWPETVAAAALPGGDSAPFELSPPHETPHQEEGELRVGGFTSVWSGPEVELSPSLAFLNRGATAELSAEDARRLGVSSGQTVVVSANGTRLEAEAVVRQAVPGGTVFLSPPNAFKEPLVTVAPKSGARAEEVPA